jgi:hypothetical protein
VCPEVEIVSNPCSNGFDEDVSLKPNVIDTTQNYQLKLMQYSKGKGVPLHAMEALEGRGDIAPTHSRPRH